MPQYIYDGTVLKPKHGWVVVNDTRMKLKQVQEMEGFEIISDVPPTPPAPPTPKDTQKLFAENVYREVSQRINAAASQATQINLAAAAAGGILTEEQMNDYKVGLAWVGSMRETGKQLILNSDADYASDEKWPALPANVSDLLEGF